jgi:putative transposase
MFGQLRKHLGEIFHELAKQKGCEIVEGHLMADHVHMCLSIPPKYAVSNVVGFIKGKSAISIARTFRGKSKNFTGENFWARDTLFRRWALTKRWFDITFESRNVKKSITSS